MKRTTKMNRSNTPVPRIYMYRQIVAAKLFIDANFREKINLEVISDQACFSKYHFHRLFKECYHHTPLEYLTSLRLNASKVLLSEGKSIQEVCSAVGFESTSSFIKLFKKHERITPLAFSKKSRMESSKIKQHPLDYIPTDFAQYLGWKT